MSYDKIKCVDCLANCELKSLDGGPYKFCPVHSTEVTWREIPKFNESELETWLDSYLAENPKKSKTVKKYRIQVLKILKAFQNETT